jgi:hypothetical protein
MKNGNEQHDKTRPPEVSAKKQKKEQIELRL